MVKVFRTISAVLLISALCAGQALAQGESGASSLIIPPSARANAMGQSFVALSEDATSLWWNPAGMAFQKRAVDFMHTQLVPDLASDVFFEYLGVIYEIEGLAVIGANIQYLTYGEWEATSETGEDLGTAKSYEFVPTIGGAIRITDNLAVGLNLKFIYVNLAPAWATVEQIDGTGHSVGVDFGVLWKVPDFSVAGYKISRLRLGSSVVNIGPSLTYKNRDQAAPLPRNLRVGFAYTPVQDEGMEITMVADVNKSLVDYFTDEDYKRSNTYHVGAEFVYAALLVIRGGYIQDKDGDIKAPTYGLGFLMLENKLRIDFASIPQASDLERVYRWSVGYNF
ncbi:MAG: PorV/PorQ family protein [Bacteroidales bacterium]|nr:PorV/PorQ family protein [Candidatus Latescibacterota bacterium]